MELEYVAEWFRFADIDFATSEHLLSMHPKPLEIICFHCQQSVEKYLKGYLIFKGITVPPKIHNLDTLCLMCAEHDDSFQQLTKACGVLTQYGTQPRYPNEMEITENDMQKALEYTRQVREFEQLVKVRNELSHCNDDAGEDIEV